MEKDIILIFKNRMGKIQQEKNLSESGSGFVICIEDNKLQLQNMFFLGQARFSFFVLHALNFIKAS